MRPRYAINRDESLLCVNQILSGHFFSSPPSPLFFFVPLVFMCDVDLNSPSVKISQRRIPYDHTSLRVVYRLWKMLSGAIHFNGRKVW